MAAPATRRLLPAACCRDCRPTRLLLLEGKQQYDGGGAWRRHLGGGSRTTMATMIYRLPTVPTPNWLPPLATRNVPTYVLGNEGKNKIRGVGSVHTTYVFDVSHPLSMRAILVHHCTAAIQRQIETIIVVVICSRAAQSGPGGRHAAGSATVGRQACNTQQLASAGCFSRNWRIQQSIVIVRSLY